MRNIKTAQNQRRDEQDISPEPTTSNQMQQFLQQAQALQPSLRAEGFEGIDGAELVHLVRSLREAIAEMDAGKGIPLEVLKAELDQRYGV